MVLLVFWQHLKNKKDFCQLKLLWRNACHLPFTFFLSLASTSVFWKAFGPDIRWLNKWLVDLNWLIGFMPFNLIWRKLDCDSSRVGNLIRVVPSRFWLLILHHLREYHELTKWPAPSWLNSSVGRVLHRFNRSHGFESRSGLTFFQALISQLLKLCVELRWSLMFS